MKILTGLVLGLMMFVSVQAQHLHRLTVVNRSGSTISALHVAYSTDNSWGIDRLGNSVMANGSGVYLDLLGHVNYMVKAIEVNGYQCTTRPFNLDTEKTVLITSSGCGVYNTSREEVSLLYQKDSPLAD